MITNLLLVEDDHELSALITQYLQKYNIQTTVVEMYDDVFTQLARDTFHIVVLDLGLIDTDGLTVCEDIRRTSQIPIIISTARGEISDKALAYEKGADDYLSKPYEPRELVLRIQAVLKRCTKKPSECIMDEKTFTINLEHGRVELSTSEFYLLKHLILNKSRVVSREELLDFVPKLSYEAQNRTIDVYISKLRHKLGDNPKEPRYIKSVWGAGYRWIM